MRTKPQDVGTIHFVGIGGIGMSGIAEVLHDLGYQVQGSDVADSANVKRLRDKGILVHIGHDASHIQNAALIVVSSAIKPDNPELTAARQARMRVVRRAEMLAELMRLKRAVAIGGTHGKTTTTSLVGAMLEAGNFDPTVINGGIVNAYGTNTRLGKSDWMVVEADESDGTFTRLPATIVVVTNIDPEHMEHYGDFETLKNAFRHYVENIPFYGYAVLCTDHPVVQNMIPDITDKKIITYGFNPQADVRAVNIRTKSGGASFDVQAGDVAITDIYFPMLGRHNVQNALAAIAIGLESGMSHAQIKQALAHFSGVKRRFTKTGESQGVTIIDDYGHHPVEIEAVLKAGRMAVEETGGKLIAVMQPHRYSRLEALFDGFCTCFNDADAVLIADVYAAGEDPITGADRDALVAGITAHGHKSVKALESADTLAAEIAAIAQAGDYVICLGAGNITQWAHALPAQLGALLKQKSSAHHS